MSRLTHLDEHGAARMVDVGAKAVTEREAVASGRILMAAETLALIQSAGIPKGDVLAVARIAGILAAKRTAELVPLCHPLPLTAVEVTLEPHARPPAVHCTASARTHGRTGVEMEALAAVQIALLTVYDMCKAVDRGMTITDVRLETKRGGQSGEWKRES
jgi:cyclic pyranopterin monophosphate synthase